MLLWRDRASRFVRGPNNAVFEWSEYVINYLKTFNNGSLGSGIDEERSEMR